MDIRHSGCGEGFNLVEVESDLPSTVVDGMEEAFMHVSVDRFGVATKNLGRLSDPSELGFRQSFS